MLNQIRKHLQGYHDQATHAGKNAGSSITTGRGTKLEIEQMKSNKALWGEVKDWNNDNRRQTASYAIASIGEKLKMDNGETITAKGFGLRKNGELVGLVSFSISKKDKKLFIMSLASKYTGYGATIMKQLAGVAADKGLTIALNSADEQSDKFYRALGMTEKPMGFFEWSPEDAAKFRNYRGA